MRDDISSNIHCNGMQIPLHRMISVKRLKVNLLGRRFTRSVNIHPQQDLKRPSIHE